VILARITVDMSAGCVALLIFWATGVMVLRLRDKKDKQDRLFADHHRLDPN
jgi:hypothetical protein